MKHLSLIVCVLLILGPFNAAAETPFETRLKELTKDMPVDVLAYVQRRLACNHWEGEEAYDAERREWIDKAMQNLHCDDLPQLEETLRNRYVNSDRIQKTLDNVKENAL